MSPVFKILAALCGGLLCSAAGPPPGVQLVPAEPAPGEVLLVRLAGADPAATDLRLELGGNRFAAWREGPASWAGLVAVDRDAQPGADLLVLEWDRAAGSLRQELPLRIARREYAVQRLQVAQRMVSLSEADQNRAAAENRRIREVLAGEGPERLWTEPFRMPVDGPVSSDFGVRRIYNDQPRSYHSGLDIAANRGTLVLAAGSGRVALVGDLFYTGNTVFLDHGLGLYTAYFHLDRIDVARDQRLEGGAVLGAVGSTGRSTGPHLHWGVYLGGVKVDPLSLLQQLGTPGAGGGESP